MLGVLKQHLKAYMRPFILKQDKHPKTYPSFTEQLGVEAWSEEKRCFLLEDGHSVGRIFELRDIPMDARPKEMVTAFHEKLTQALAQIVPMHAQDPWVLQVFVQDEPSLASLNDKMQALVPEALKDDPLTHDYLTLMEDHVDYLTQKDGIFKDPLSGTKFQGKTKRIRAVLYRRYQKVDANINRMHELDQVTEQWMSRLQTLGIKVRVLSGKHIYDWWVRWFNPNPRQGSTEALLKQFPYPEHEPAGWDFAEQVFFNEPKSVAQGWVFDGLVHKVMLLDRLRQSPEPGAISRERKQASNLSYALLDVLPQGTIFTTQIVFEDQDNVAKHLRGIEQSAIGMEKEVVMLKHDIEEAHYQIKQGNPLLRVTHAIYYCGGDEAVLNTYENHIMNALNQLNLTAVSPMYEKNPLDMYLRFLPFNYDVQFEQQRLYRSSYQYASEVASLLPLYGRSRGDGQHPLFTFYNRGGEPFIFDPYHPSFKMANSHMFVVGGTGAGKSVFINTIILPLLALKNARVVVIEAGGSFDLLTQYIASQGKKVTKMTFDRQKPIAMNPFSEAYTALEAILAEEDAVQARSQKIMDAIKSKDDISLDDNRDILAEMVMALRNMITGGIPAEEARFTLSDLNLVTETLIEAIKDCHAKQIPQVLIEHIVDYFERKAQTSPLGQRLDDMARTMKSFKTMPNKARFFNRPSEPLQDSDYMHINLGFLQDTNDANNMVMMSLLMISLLSKILAIAEQNQRSDRPTILIMDEAHIPMKNPLVCAFLVLMAKVARKIGLWLMPVTQNVKDFHDVEARKVLSMMETWLCLAVSPDEVDHINQLRKLTPEQESLILNIQKYPGLYSEGVLLSSRYQGLFRNIPPRFALAMAMTEQFEKAERQKLMEACDIDELTAAKKIGETLKTAKQRVTEDEGFDD